MAGLPDGWEADYDGSRWFYRYKPTGLAQFKFPRLGDEFPELVGLGFGPLDLAPEDELASEQQAKRRSGLDRIYNVGEVKKTSGNAMEVINKEDVPRSRGYFDPGGFMYFDPNEYTDISPVAIEENDITNLSSGEQTACELPEGPKQMWSQVGFIAELATSDTVKCAEELAPIELDATSSLQIPSRTNLPQNKAVELPTNRSPVEQEQSEQGTALPTMQPVEEDEYPLVSASFAYPPLKGTARPVNNAAPLQSSSSSQEPKVLTTERPTPSQPGQDKYQSWTPLQREQAETSKRQSMTLSNISILQLQNTELCPIQQKRHSLPGPIDSRKATPKLPDIMKPPTDPRLSVGALTPRPEAQHSPIPAVLQPAQASAQVSITQENHKQRPLGARHQSFPSDPGSTSKNDIDSNSSLSHTPSVLKPAQRRKSSQITQIQHIQNPHLPSPVRMPVYGDDAHPDYHRVDPLLKQTPSHTRPPPMMNGPGILVFHEIPSTQGLIIEQERVEGHRTSHVETQVSTATKTSSNDAITTSQNHEICDSTKQSYCPMDEPLPVVAPLSLSRPGRSGSPDKISAKINTLPQAPSSQSMPSELPAATITVASNSSPLPGSTERPTAHIYHSSHASPIQTPVPHHGLSGPAHAASNQMDIPAGEHHTSLQQITSSTGPTKPYSGAQAESHPVGHQVPTGQQTESHNDTHPSTLITSQQGPAEQVHGIHSGTHSQSQSATIIRPNSEAPVQAVSHRPEIGSPVSSHVQSVANTPIQPTSGQVLSSGSQKPPSIPLSQIASSSQSTMVSIAKPSNQSTMTGSAPGQSQTQHSSPITHPVSPLSQMSSPAYSIASIYRPPSSTPSSASSHVRINAQGAVTSGLPSAPATPSHYSNTTKPTEIPLSISLQQPNASSSSFPQHTQQSIHQQNPQIAQPASSQFSHPVTSPLKPFPMLPGQVKPLPSQVRPTLGPTAIQHPSIQAQYLQGNVRPTLPAQSPGTQPLSQALTTNPQQQHLISGQPSQVYSASNPGKPTPNQSMPGTTQPVQHLPHVQMTPTQQNVPLQTSGQPMSQGSSQAPPLHSAAGSPQAANNVNAAPYRPPVQPQLSQTIQSPVATNTPSPVQQPTLASQFITQGQQLSQPCGGHVVPQASQQSKPFNSAQAVTALSDVGKGVKKFAKKAWKNPTVKQATATLSGAFIAGSLGVSDQTGAALANQLYHTSQARPQAGRPQRPPGLVHAQTAPVQAQGLNPMTVTYPYTQVVNRPQQVIQPMQTSGRPSIMQNQPGTTGATGNVYGQPQAGAMQRPPQKIHRPPVGRPSPQAQRPSASGQPLAQGQGVGDSTIAAGLAVGSALATAVLRADARISQQGQNPTQYQEHPAHQQAHPAHYQEHLTQYQGHPAQYQEHPAQHQDHAGQHQENNPGYNQESSTQYQETSTQYQEYTTQYQEQPAQPQPQPTESYQGVDNSTAESQFSSQAAYISDATSTVIDTTTYTDTTVYTDTTTNVDMTAYTDSTTYGNDTTAYTDTTTNVDVTAYTDNTTYVSDTTYTDTMYTDTAYTDTTYMDATAVDVNVDVNVDINVDMDQTVYMEDTTSVWASSSVDYSGGDYGGGDW